MTNELEKTFFDTFGIEKLVNQRYHTSIYGSIENCIEKAKEWSKETGIKIKNTQTQQRVYNTGIIKQLKNLYKGKCQICAHRPFSEFTENICEVHHIKYFALSHNNNSSNLVVLCPNHHRLIHKLNPEFNAQKKSFVFNDGTELKILLDYHLSEE